MKQTGACGRDADATWVETTPPQQPCHTWTAAGDVSLASDNVEQAQELLNRVESRKPSSSHVTSFQNIRL